MYLYAVSASASRPNLNWVYAMAVLKTASGHPVDISGRFLGVDNVWHLLNLCFVWTRKSGDIFSEAAKTIDYYPGMYFQLRHSCYVQEGTEAPKEPASAAFPEPPSAETLAYDPEALTA